MARAVVESRKRSVDTGLRIRETALRLFAARGYAAAGIREIAQDAGVTTAALYHHMGSKQDLLLTLMRDAMHEMIAVAREAISEADGPADQLAALARAHVSYNGEHLLDALVGDTEIRSLVHANRDRIVRLRDTYEDVWADVIARGVKIGEFRIGDQRLFRLAVIQMCNGVASWYTPAGSAPLLRIADEFAGFALSMAGCQTGAGWVSGAAAAYG